MNWSEFEKEAENRGYQVAIEKEIYGGNDTFRARPINGGRTEGISLHMDIYRRCGQRQIVQSKKEVLTWADDLLKEMDAVREACSGLVAYAKALKSERHENPEVHSDGIRFQYGKFNLHVKTDLTVYLEIKGYWHFASQTTLEEALNELGTEEARIKTLLSEVTNAG